MVTCLAHVSLQQGDSLQPLLKIAGIAGGIAILVVAIRLVLGKKI